ncbi:carbohydrate esterase family 4 protein [Polychaeton citri CBS 116435]|uniref:chitin deacetylase n=1 Tax=Polychaeton citri CBS 116435 TaxID=1314669 RepID=A0A9P4UP54_9PEZI|nr:carbohydrate esterase family 4 protein [Polychaeton citri CBS 116435]
MATLTSLLAVGLLVLVPIYTIYKPPKIIISYLQHRFPEVLFQVVTTQKIVALTIDDAPSEYTNKILDVLKTNGASATFFAIGGQIPGREQTLHNIIQAGSEVGNHAMHDEPSISLSSEQLTNDILTVDGLIVAAYEKALSERSARYFRPGSGVFSRRILHVATRIGYRTILGSIYPHDPFIKYWWINARHVLSMVRPGAIIICHDRRSWTVPMLQKVLPEMKKRGYEVVSVSQLLQKTSSS